MAGPYAHITLLHELMNSFHPEGTHRLPEEEVVNAVRDHFHFCVLGSVSPDIPNLSPDAAGAAWGDAMHYARTGEMVIRGVRLVADSPPDVRPRLLAWLLGYCAHLVTDATIHPVVRIRVGDYAENRRQHRICEMNQDAHVFARMNCGELRDSSPFTRDIVACSESDAFGLLDLQLASLWDALLLETHPRQYLSNPPPIQEWFGRFCQMSGEGSSLFPLAEVISVGIRRKYPLADDVDPGFVLNLRTPSGDLMNYDDVFDKAVAGVGESWDLVGRGVVAGDRDYLSRFGAWDLDTGLDEQGRLVFWL